MKGVKVSILSQNYNPGNRRFEFVKSNEYISNKVGRVNINEQIDQNIKFVLSHKADILDLNQYHYNYMRQDNSENKFAEFFTDRSIYRPGQIIYFKAILLKMIRIKFQTSFQTPLLKSYSGMQTIRKYQNSD